MATYLVKYSPAAYRAFEKLDPQIRKRLTPHIDALTEDPRPASAKQLAGVENLLRIRVGAYRVVYQVQDDVLLVLVVKLGHRRDVYRDL